MELVNSRIATLKAENTKHHPTKLLLFKKYFLKQMSST